MPPKRKPRREPEDEANKSEAEPSTKRQKKPSSECGDSQPVPESAAVTTNGPAERPVQEEFDLPDATLDEIAQLELVRTIIESAKNNPEIVLNESETILLYWFGQAGLSSQAMESIEEYESYGHGQEEFDPTKYKRLMDRSMLTLAARLVDNSEK